MPLMHYNVLQWAQTSQEHMILVQGVSNYNIGKHLGNHSETLLHLFSGTSRIFKYLNAPLLIFLGNANRKIMTPLTMLISQLRKNGILFNIVGTWLNPNIITLNLFNFIMPASLVSFYTSISNEESNATLILVNNNNLRAYRIRHTIYLGHHAALNMSHFSLILPIRHYFETTGYFINFQGVLQKSNKAIDNSEYLYSIYDIFYLILLMKTK
jgi:hypothetical protein